MTICLEEFEGLVKVYEPLLVDCPPLNQRVVVEFAFRTPNRGAEGRTRVAFSRAVSSTNGSATGLAMKRHGIFWEGDCGVEWFWSDSPDDILNPAIVNNSGCAPLYESPDKLCIGQTHNNNIGTIYRDVLGVWNTGGCQGQLLFEASLRNSPFGNYGTGDCVQPLKQVCAGTAISNVTHNITASSSAPTILLPTASPTTNVSLSAARSVALRPSDAPSTPTFPSTFPVIPSAASRWDGVRYPAFLWLVYASWISFW